VRPAVDTISAHRFSWAFKSAVLPPFLEGAFAGIIDGSQ
jgi:hypothetical protein